MNIIVEHQGVKRIISGPFNICGTRADFMDLRDQLAQGCVDDFSYGWVKVRRAEEPGKADTKPLHWRCGVQA